MRIEYNNIFRNYLTEYDLPPDLSFSVEIPEEVRKMLSNDILVGPLGVALSSSGKLYKARHALEDQSIIEDAENHFHVDWYIDPPDNRKAFKLAVKTLLLLAEKFRKEGIKGIRFWLSFQTPELGLQWAKQNNLHSDGDEYYISDRLSFYTRRHNEDIITISQNDNTLSAILIVDI